MWMEKSVKCIYMYKSLTVEACFNTIQTRRHHTHPCMHRIITYSYLVVGGVAGVVLDDGGEALDADVPVLLGVFV